VKVALGVVGLNLLGNCTLIWTPLREAGLAWSTAACSIVQVLLLMWLMRKRMEFTLDADVVRSWMKTAAVTAAMAGLVWGAMYAVPAGDSWASACGELAVAVVVGIVAAFALARMMKMPELWWAVGRSVRE
jgi:peptidoglycan biosynthesis protein MviN/MurJ (putative lipid II flippase)